MTGNAQAWRESLVHVARTDLMVIKGGTGRPLLVLHEELGHPGWLRWHAALAQSHTLYIPLHPGFGTSPRVEWVSCVRDLACFYARVLQEMRLSPIDVMRRSTVNGAAIDSATLYVRSSRPVAVSHTRVPPCASAQ